MSSGRPSEHVPGKWRINWRHVGIIYNRELKAALRDRTVVTNSILIPVFLYPFLLWAGLSVMMFIQGQSDNMVSKVVITGLPEEHSALRLGFKKQKNLFIAETNRLPRDLRAAIRNDQFDAAVVFSIDTFSGVSILPLEARITSDETLQRSAQARRRIVSILEEYRGDWIKREARNRGINAATWQVFETQIENTASKTQMGAFVLSILLPVIFSVMVAGGCFYPAVDTMAGERERGTWETLLSTAAQRGAILIAKYLHVVTFGGLAGTLNVFAVLLTVKPLLTMVSPSAAEAIDSYAAWRALPLMAIGAVLLAGFIAAGMMIFAATARTFKEGQAMITPFYLVVLFPMVFLQVPGLKLSVGTACIPVINLILMMRGAVGGGMEPLPVAIALLMSGAAIALVLSIAAYLLRFEEVATGSHSGSVLKFISRRLFRRPKQKGLTR